MTFTAKPAVREAVPLLMGITGASSSGKTWSALEMATGMVEVRGGKILVLDSESKRALHYADRFKFDHAEFNAPFASTRYLEAVEWAVNDQKASVVIIDSASHEHEGPGGYLDFHEHELDRLAGDDYQKRMNVNMLAWAKPSQQRRDFIGGLTRLNACFILCFRAKEKIKLDPKARDRNERVIDLGWMPIAGPELVYEMTVQALLEPNSKGVPTWEPEEKGSRSMVKMPEQFIDLFKPGEPLHRKHGRAMALWAAGKEWRDEKKAALPAANWPEKTTSHLDNEPLDGPQLRLIDATGLLHDLPLPIWRDTLAKAITDKPFDRAHTVWTNNEKYVEAAIDSGAFIMAEAGRAVKAAWKRREYAQQDQKAPPENIEV